MTIRRLLAIAFALLLSTVAFGDDARTERLEKLCRVWATAKYTHPAMLRRTVDWDGALLRAIPKVREASDAAQLAAAVGAMLEELGDPATRVIAPSVAPVKKDVPLIRHEGEVLVVNIGPAAVASSSIWSQADTVAKEVEKAEAVVVDTSVGGDPDAAEDVDYALSKIRWTRSEVDGPASLAAFHSGYAPQDETSSGGYFSALLLAAGDQFPAGKSAPARIVFIADGTTPLPEVAVALWQAGKAAIVASAPVSNVARVKRVELTGGYSAVIRSGEYATGDITADRITTTPLDEAVKLAKSPAPLQSHKPETRSTPAVHAIKERPYTEMTSPDLPHRLLAAFRIWSVIDAFYPYKALIGDWDAVLREFIPRFEDAEGEDAYVRAVYEMTAHIEDGHTTVFGPPMATLFGPAFLPVTVRVIEGEAVVVDKHGSNAPLEVGDVITAVDGEPLALRVRNLWKYLPASTEWARKARVTNAAFRGAKDSVAQLEVRGADGKTRNVAVPRTTSFPAPPSIPAYRTLEDGIGYADLRQLKPGDVDAMFDALMKTKAIIFDMRGYPNGTAWPIAPRINTRHAKVGATFRRVQHFGGSSGEESAPGYSFEQLLPKSDKPVYGGKVIVLIDERAISQAEHTCLFFEQAAGATFIGSPTAGANGDVTNFPLPGGLTVYFTGHDVRHADGRQLQRVGIQPDIRVEPTIAGIRAGKDEVLDRAIAYVKTGK